MHYAENIGLRDCSGFLQIGSHIVKHPLVCVLVFMCSKSISVLYSMLCNLRSMRVVYKHEVPLPCHHLAC